MKTTQGSSDENVNAALCFIRDVDMHFLDMYFSDKVLNTKKTRKHKDVVFYMIKFHHVSCYMHPRYIHSEKRWLEVDVFLKQLGTTYSPPTLTII